MKDTNDLSTLLIEKTQECDKMKHELKTILMNTIHRDFNGDVMYKAGVLTSIRLSLGDEEYNRAVELYS